MIDEIYALSVEEVIEAIEVYTDTAIYRLVGWASGLKSGFGARTLRKQV
jgi:hypothetical protein